MRRGFSLKWLLAMVAAAGAGCWSLRNASYQTNGYLLLCVFAVLAVSLLGALVRTGLSRAFWIGATVFGWIAFLVNGGPAQSLTSSVALPTDRAIQFLHTMVVRTLTPDEAVQQGWYSADQFRAAMRPRTIALPMSEYFHDAARHLTTLLAACLGGLLGRRFYRLNAIASEPTRATN